LLEEFEKFGASNRDGPAPDRVSFERAARYVYKSGFEYGIVLLSGNIGEFQGRFVGNSGNCIGPTLVKDFA